MRKKQYRLQRCIFQLMTDSGWKFILKGTSGISLMKRGDRHFNIDKEDWEHVPDTYLTIGENTFKYNGKLSIFDMEVLEFYGYKPE